MRCGLATAVAFGVLEHPLSGPQTGDRNGRSRVLWADLDVGADSNAYEDAKMRRFEAECV